MSDRDTVEPRRVSFEEARLALARVNVEATAGLDTVVANATRICAEALGVERVGVWQFDEQHEELRCLNLYTRSTGIVTRGETLQARGFPSYCRALETCRAIVADDARTHPCLTPGLDEYMRAAGITSMLDTPVFRGGRVLGVVCHEHVGPPRRWTPAEIEFASAVAEIVALMFEQAERVRAELALHELSMRTREMERLLELRRLARAIAHDFDSVLTAAAMFTSIMRRRGPTEELERGVTESIEVGRRLAQELIRFSDPELESRGVTTAKVVATVQGMAGALRMLVRHRADLRITIEREDAEVSMRPLELEQVVLNLCMNARDAIVEDGVIEIVVRGEDDVVLEVRDNGSGMDEDVQRRVFEPYFTTKREGTGIGLAVVLDNVTRVGGTLELDSAVGRGTTVRVFLPLAGPLPH